MKKIFDNKNAAMWIVINISWLTTVNLEFNYVGALTLLTLGWFVSPTV